MQKALDDVTIKVFAGRFCGEGVLALTTYSSVDGIFMNSPLYLSMINAKHN